MNNQKIIVLRFSAMGDVAMVASVLKELVVQNPTCIIVMVSRKAFAPFFEDIPQVIFHAIEPKGKHKGLNGLRTLYKELKQHKQNAVADLHDNIRSRVVSLFFRLGLTKIARLDKGRKEKKALTRKENKVLIQLKPTVERYADVFKQLGLKITLKNELFRNPKSLPQKAEHLFKTDKPKIGISPFAQHSYKVYPKDKMATVIQKLSLLGYEVLLFGGGPFEKKTTEAWEAQFPNTHSLVGKFNLSEELAIISNLDLMLSMDSSGMHMASLMGIPCISIWGPTHPYAGFLGYGQSYNDCLQIDAPNRPNSIYGNKPCLCGVEPCINLITPDQVVKKIQEKIDA